MRTVHLFSNDTFKNSAVMGRTHQLGVMLPTLGGIMCLDYLNHKLWGWSLGNGIHKSFPTDSSMQPRLRIIGLEFSEVSFFFLIILTASPHSQTSDTHLDVAHPAHSRLRGSVKTEVIQPLVRPRLNWSPGALLHTTRFPAAQAFTRLGFQCPLLDIYSIIFS